MLTLLAVPASAQRYNFKFYGEEEGLDNLVVQVVHQDHAGFLWVGTQNGLFRYDGNRFVAFSRAEGLPSNRIDSLQEAIDGVLWVGTRNGLARRAGDRFEPVSIGVAHSILGRDGIGTDGQGRLYLATERGLVVGERTGSTYSFEGVASPPGLAGEPAISVYVDGAGTVWYGCGASLCTLENGVAREIGPAQGLPRERWFTIRSNVDGDVWVRSEHGLYRRAASSKKFELLGGLPESSNTYPTMVLDPSGRLLVPTDQGLARQTRNG